MKHLKIIRILTIVLGMVLFTEIFVRHYFPHLTFFNSSVAIANRIVGYFCFSGFLFSIPILFKASKLITVPLGILMFLFFFINSYVEIYPIDTTTEPQDKFILRTYEDGNKLIVREYKNVKTNEIIRDTVLVKDKFIFRQIIQHNK
jgi:hypothetical protein